MMAYSLLRVDLREGTFRQEDANSENPWMPVKSIPTDVYTELLQSNKIPDPRHDLNELAVRWVADKDFTFKMQFKAPKDTFHNADVRTDMVFEGLDTFATVFLNGAQVLESDNMFLSHRVDVSNHLKSDNILEIFFKSARLRGEELLKEHGHEHRFIARQTEDCRIPVRKAQYHFGWDWGPILSGTCGPWRPVYLEQYIARIDDIWIQYGVTNEVACCGQLVARVDDAIESDRVYLSLAFDREVVAAQECFISVDGTARLPFLIQEPKLWYPRGYGSPDRYQFTAILRRDDHDLDTKRKLVGFRDVQLVQEPDAFGKSFYFRINGVDVFSGGSCWIPGSSYLPELKRRNYQDWIKLFVEGNQVMIRVWGGGIYEDDAFYDTCDELGILVWQDFAFACGNYPTYPSFVDSVEREARQNVRRIRNHPSLVIWAGSNEDYQVQERYKLDYDFEDKNPESWLKSSFPARYFYEYLLPKVVKEEAFNAAYHPTSPWGDGLDTADPTVGDIHQWNIWHGNMVKYQFAGQLSGRFISEFGMEAYPHVETIETTITNPKQRYPGSMTMDFHNKAIGHERRLISYIAENFQVKYDLHSFTHLSQMVQAEAMHFAYKTWRREWGAPGSRKCGGVLVWQFNDCYPTMSWAVVDYYLVKKPAFYSIARALEPMAIGVSRTVRDWSKKYMNPMLDLGHVDPTLDAREDTKFDVWIASNRTQPIESRVTVRFISIRTGRDVLDPMDRLVKVNPNATTEVLAETIAPIYPEYNDLAKPFDVEKYDPYIIHASLSVDDQVVSIDTAWPQPLKYLDFSDRGLTFETCHGKNQIVIRTERPVKGLVFEESRATKLSSNNFDVVPGEEILVDVAGIVPDELRFTYVGAPVASVKVCDAQSV